MNEHYYSEQPTVKSEHRTITFEVRGEHLTLDSDAGVFSKVGLDFGTRLLIETVQLPEQAHVVDLGCGYGVVGAVLSRVYPGTTWILVDVNSRAVELARRNTAGLGDRVSVIQADGLAAARLRDLDAVLINPPIRAGKRVVYRLFSESAKKLRPSGVLWVVMHKKHGAGSAKDFLETLFSQVDVASKKSGYHIFRCEGPLGGVTNA